MQASVIAQVHADRNRLQEYFNAFLCDKWVHPPEEQLNRLLADFLTEHSAWMSGVDMLGVELVENKLSDWLEERLPSVGLWRALVVCKIDSISNFTI